MVKMRDPTCCWDIFKMKGRSEEMLLRMIGEEGGVAVVRINSNDKRTPYISPKETLNPTTEWRMDHQQMHHRPTFHQMNSHTLKQ